MSIAMDVWNEAKKHEDLFDSSIERNAYVRDQIIEKVQELMEQVVEQTNCSYMDEVIEGMLLGVNKSHRYRQQEFWNAMATLCRKYSNQEETRYFDGRNIQSKELTKRMADAAQI